MTDASAFGAIVDGSQGVLKLEGRIDERVDFGYSGNSPIRNTHPPRVTIGP